MKPSSTVSKYELAPTLSDANRRNPNNPTIRTQSRPHTKKVLLKQMTVYEVRCLNCQKRVSEDRYTHARTTRNNFQHRPGCAQKNVQIRSFESKWLRKIQRPSPGTTRQQKEVQTQ